MRRWRIVVDVRGVPSIRRDLLDAYIGHLEPVARPFPDGSGVRVTVTISAATLERAMQDARRALERLTGGPVAIVEAALAAEAS